MPDDEKTESLERLQRPLGLVFGAYFGILFLAAFLYTAVEWHRGGPTVVWASAAWITGTALGFLFAFPKVIQDDKGDSAAQGHVLYKLLINTNFADISDWLTKIIVGLSLIHAQKIWAALVNLSERFSESVSGHQMTESGLGLALLVAFSGGGILFGYLYTRLYLSLLFVKADKEMFRGITEQIKVEVQSQTISTERKLETIAGAVADKVVSNAETPDIQQDPATMELLNLATQGAADKDANDPLKLYLRALHALNERKFEDTIRLGEAALKLDLSPKRQWLVLNLLGLAYHYQQPDSWTPKDPTDWFDKSLEYYRKALDSHPSNADATLTRANMVFLYLDKDDPAEAQRIAQSALAGEASPELAGLKVFDLLRLGLAFAFAMQNRDRDAVATLNQIKNIRDWEYLFTGNDLDKDMVRKIASLDGLSPAVKEMFQQYSKKSAAVNASSIAQ